MRALIIVMLVVQAGIFLVTVATVTVGRPAAGRPRPMWSSLAISLVVVAGASWQTADRHFGEAGADVIAYCSPLLLGMGLMAALLAIRQRRGLDSAP
jgi:cytochrome bd-type quinol oxidase subunit 2